ncbi:hypothetical protein N7474_006191 [Penicillium riverlandense]|uniref:uncharacterized protein n=1 Tax=Penicillium riverlandense TaxID=1903569 RepID=UPI002549B833|nr:uncharacterized protein N7474_006191 [Penicillium riverlandense]KAJ5820600.1 hypothetical protein N7474_006191 [Penicillium riverlandense]
MIGKTGEVNPGNIFINVRTQVEEGTSPTIYDNNGDMIWQGTQRKSMDFKMQKLFGEDVITYWDGETGVLGYGYGRVHILDTSYKEIYTVTLPDQNFVTPDGRKRDTYVDVHEHLITPRGSMIVSAINITQGDTSMRPAGHPDTWIIDGLFYEVDIKTNEIIFSWSASEHQDFLPLGGSKSTVGGHGGAQHNPWDCYHINSIQYVNHGYLVSVRYYCYALYINHDGTKRWILSGWDRNEGDILNDAHFAWQHDIRARNETDDSMVITVFNNDLPRGDSSRTESTGIAINVDLKNMTGVVFRRVNSHGLDPAFAATQGSLQLLDYNTTGHMLVSYGSHCRWREFDSAGNIAMTGQFGYPGHAQAYRTLKYPWHAIPHYPPTAVAKYISKYTSDVYVYMSWNGCTEHDNWNIYSVPAAGSTVDEGTLLGNHPKGGFETHANLRDPTAQFLIVEALQGDKSLGFSQVIKVPLAFPRTRLN